MAAAKSPTPARVAMIVPMLNEEASLASFLSDSLATLRETVATFEVILVDDGSTDGTRAIAERLASQTDELQTVHHQKNRGIGAAVRTGLALATAEWVFYYPVDARLTRSEIEAYLLSASEGADIVIGCRDASYRPGPVRALQSDIYELTLWLALGLDHLAVNWIQFYRRSAIEAIAFRADGVFFHAEVIAHAEAKGLAIATVPVPWRPRRVGGASGGRPLRILETIGDLARFTWRR